MKIGKKFSKMAALLVLIVFIVGSEHREQMSMLWSISNQEIGGGKIPSWAKQRSYFRQGKNFSFIFFYAFVSKVAAVYDMHTGWVSTLFSSLHITQ